MNPPDVSLVPVRMFPESETEPPCSAPVALLDVTDVQSVKSVADRAAGAAPREAAAAKATQGRTLKWWLRGAAG